MHVFHGIAYVMVLNEKRNKLIFNDIKYLFSRYCVDIKALRLINIEIKIIKSNNVIFLEYCTNVENDFTMFLSGRNGISLLVE
jgi:hypothetical protein